MKRMLLTVSTCRCIFILFIYFFVSPQTTIKTQNLKFVIHMLCNLHVCTQAKTCRLCMNPTSLPELSDACVKLFWPVKKWFDSRKYKARSKRNRHIQLEVFSCLFLIPCHRKCKKRLPFSQWLKCEIPQLMTPGRLQLQVGVAAEPQKHACQFILVSFFCCCCCNMNLMCSLYVWKYVIDHSVSITVPRRHAERCSVMYKVKRCLQELNF